MMLITIIITMIYSITKYSGSKLCKLTTTEQTEPLKKNEKVKCREMEKKYEKINIWFWWKWYEK